VSTRLLAPKSRATTARLPDHTARRCPILHFRACWCRGLCAPDANGLGQCGHLAPHGLVGRTQRAMARATAAPRTPVV
jgi:hypothetical protein